MGEGETYLSKIQAPLDMDKIQHIIWVRITNWRLKIVNWVLYLELSFMKLN
jgi:hypothetical protein